MCSHGESHGIPPQIDEQTFPNVYRSYFENQYGEQAIFLYDYEQKRGTLYVGDAGWEHLYNVVDGKVPELILSHPEQAWLLACWKSSEYLKRVPIVRPYFDATPASPLEAFEIEASRHPVFRIIGSAGD